MHRQMILLAFVLLLLASCVPAADPAEQTGVAPIRTDQETYTLNTTDDAVELTIEASYVNDQEDSSYIARCGSSDLPRYQLEKRVDDAWVTVYRTICPAILTAPIDVEAGGTYSSVLTVESMQAPNAYPRFEVPEIPGVYRLVYDIYGDWEQAQGAGSLLPKEARVSNSFTISE